MFGRFGLQRASTQAASRAATPSSAALPVPAAAIAQRLLTTTLQVRNASPAETKTPTLASAVPLDLIPVGGAAAAAPPEKPALSSCPAGTPLIGLNYLKGKSAPVALPDEEYPEWLWRCLEVVNKKADGDDLNVGDEFSKSKKQRRLALKRQRQLEAKILASGDLSALAPKIPLQRQSVNLTPRSGGIHPFAAVNAREELRRAMREERRAKIKEDNYLKSM